MGVEFPHPSEGNARPWRTIAKELTTEQDPKHFEELTQELCRAMDEQEATLQRKNKALNGAGVA
jgi:hypothetical protein